MENIQKIAEKLLLTFYTIYRKQGYISEDSISFSRDEKWEVESDDESLLNILLKITDGSVLDLKAALVYLREKRLIKYSEYGTMSGDFDLMNIEVTSKGVDIIEGATGPQTSKIEYQNIFNVKLAENINLESLVKTELGSIFKLL